MPSYPRGARPARPATPTPLVLEVPAVSPQRRLHALRAFVKPHDWTREAVRHRIEADADGTMEQAWQPEFAEIALVAARAATERLGLATPHCQANPDTETRFRLTLAEGIDPPFSRAVAVVCSRRLAATWWTLGDLALLDGRFWRRERGRKLHLRPAADVHLPRPVRAAIRDLL